MLHRLTLLVLFGFLMTTAAVAEMPPALAEQVAKLTADDAAEFDNFGQSVALSDTTALIGANRDDDSGQDSGSAYIFERDGAGNWSQVAKLVADDAAAGDHFGYSVALSGTTAVVGARSDDDGGTDSGSAYIFERDEGGAGNWGQVAKLTADDAAAGDQFGYSVALSSSTALVGAIFGHDGGSGSAYVFERDPEGAETWAQVAKLTASDAGQNDAFGISVALSGTTAVVGAFLDDDGGTDSGSAYVFERDQGGSEIWGQVAKLTADNPETYDFFGISVALNGTTALVGALLDDEGGEIASGSAYVFERDQGGAGVWGKAARITAGDGATGDHLGISVALDGTKAIVGAVSDDDGGTNSGSAYVFERDSGGTWAWGQVAKLTADDAAERDTFGISVALSGTTALIGALGNDDGSRDSGSAYVFNLAETSCALGSLDDGELTDWNLAGVGHANQVSVETADYPESIELTADGATAYLGADNAGFFYREITGDFRIETQVDVSGMDTGKPWRKAGLMARASLDHVDLRLLATVLPEQERLQFVARTTFGGPGNVKLGLEVPGAPAVVDLAIERVGQSLSVQYSLDGGTTWITPADGLGGSVEIDDLPPTLLVGPAVVSNDISVTSTAQFLGLTTCAAP